MLARLGNPATSTTTRPWQSPAPFQAASASPRVGLQDTARAAEEEDALAALVLAPAHRLPTGLPTRPQCRSTGTPSVSFSLLLWHPASPWDLRRDPVP
ncbi:hypothetical protein LEMLEM_LOCUS13907 [Lemmus lemmus]